MMENKMDNISGNVTDLVFSNENYETQSRNLFAQNIVKTLGKKLFTADKAMSCLAKSDMFFKELLNVFNKLYAVDIKPENFHSVVSKLQTSQTDKTRLKICSKLYENYISIMEKNGYKVPLGNQKLFKIPPTLNTGIQKKYLEFSDIQNESLYIISKIESAIANGIADYSEFAVFADKAEARQKFLDLMKTKQIPVTSSIYNEDYENLKHKIDVYHKISELKLKLETEVAKSQKEILTDELNLTINTLLEEITPQTDEAKAIEYASIKAFYEIYKENDYAKAIETVLKRFFAKFENTSVKDIAARKIKSLNELQKLYNTVLEEKPDFNAFKEIMEWLPQDKTKDKNSVRLGSITTDLKENENFKFVFIAGLTENNFPSGNTSYPFISLRTNEILTNELKKLNPDFDFFIKTDEIHFEQKYHALLNITQHAVEELTLTTHVYEAKKSVQPSVFFKSLKDRNPENFEKIDVLKTISGTEKNSGNLQTFHTETQIKTVISDTDILKLSPSAISAFQQCKRKYYYKNLLNLKEDSTFSASYGNVVHAVFEVLNRRFLNAYNKKTALCLAEVLFDIKKDEENMVDTDSSNSQKAIQAGFKQTDIDLIKATDKLSLKEMEQNFESAIEDFDMLGYFDEPPVKAVCEKTFSFSLPTIYNIPNIIFEGRIDAILTDKDGKNIIIDYKTGKNKINPLEYAISEYGVNFKSKTGKDPSNVETLQNNYDYQIPIYYLACQNSEELQEYRDKILQLGLIYMRPKSKHDGCDDDFVSAEKIEFYKEKIVQNLKETVIDKIVNEKEFKPQKSFNCDNCTYKFLCDNGDVGDDDE